MKTIADFKNKMILGAKVKTEVYWFTENHYVLHHQWEQREVSVVQSNSFACKTWSDKENKAVDSWCAWPTKKEFYPLSAQTAELRYQGVKIVYTFIDV